MSCSSAEGEHTAVVDQGLRVPASLARVKYGMGGVWQMWAKRIIGAWNRSVASPRLEPATGLTRFKKGIEEPLGTGMRQQAFTKIVEHSEMEARIAPLQAERIFPIDTTAHGSGGLTISEPCDILHHHHYSQAPRRDLYTVTTVCIEIGKKVLLIKRAKLRTQVHIQVPFGKCGLNKGRRGLRHW